MSAVSLAKLDVDAFWVENAKCLDMPFSTQKPRAPLTLGLDDHWLLDEIRVPSTVRYYRDAEYRAEINRQGNQRCQQEIGFRPFSETVAPPGPRRIEEVMGCRTEILEGGTPWLEAGYSTPDELRAALKEIEHLDEKEILARALEGGRVLPESREERVVWSRGPATIATSVLGTERFLTWLFDEPDLLHHFFAVLEKSLVQYHRATADAQGATLRGMAWLDDNCALLSPQLYEEFCFPCLKAVTEAFAQNPEDIRFQHSDSAMGHLLPILARLNLHGVNFGPTVDAASIRAAMPQTVVHGQVAPFTLRNGACQDVRREVRRDFAAAGLEGGIVVTTAGSVPAGTSFESMRGLMIAVQEECRYGG